MILLLCETIGPKPMHYSETLTKFGVPTLQMSCTIDVIGNCSADYFESFNFFKQGFFNSKTPQNDYSSYGLPTVSNFVNVKIANEPYFNILELNESY